MGEPFPGTLPFVWTAGVKDGTEVKVSATVTKPDSAGKQMLTVTLVHAEGWHTYANPVDNDGMDSGKTVVTVVAKGKRLDAKVDYPAGKVTKGKTVGDYNVYETKVDIQAVIQRAGGTSALWKSASVSKRATRRAFACCRPR